LPISPPSTLPVRLAVDLPAGRDLRPAYLPGRLASDVQLGMMARPVAWSGSDDPFGLAEANCLLVRQRPLEPMAAGASIECMPIRDEWD
ncbi:MAG TPA: hypothetical protein VMV81_04255, partial [Phycisphaerae bacterium]|nr:hypothetical protein [Phycisphaerae bacterium]